MRSRYRCSMCPAIHINSRSWLRSSSTHEPSDPPLRVVYKFRVRERVVFSRSPETDPDNDRNGRRQSEINSTPRGYCKRLTVKKQRPGGRSQRLQCGPAHAIARLFKPRPGDKADNRTVGPCVSASNACSLRLLTPYGAPRTGFRRTRYPNAKTTARSPPPAHRKAGCILPTRRAYARRLTSTVDGLFTARLRTRSHGIGSELLSLVAGLHDCRQHRYVNDPSAGSPTETLLRLLLPLDDQV